MYVQVLLVVLYHVQNDIVCMHEIGFFALELWERALAGFVVRILQ